MPARHAEAIFLRLFPGILNAVALLLLGDVLSIEEYGIFSLSVASSAFVVILFFGPLYLGSIAQYAHVVASGAGQAYDSSYISMLALISVILVVIGSGAIALNVVGLSWLLATIAFGLYSSLLEILRGRVHIWRYGLASLLQSILYLGLIYFAIGDGSDHNHALTAFAISYGVAALLGLLMLGKPRFRIPDVSLMADTIRLGVGYVVSNTAEQGLYLGMRYVILLFGSSQALGVFSFSVDFAQRTVGFLINAASFIFIPLAFRENAQGACDRFAATLQRATKSSLLLSALAFLGIMAIRKLELVPALTSDLFDDVLFSIVCGAIVLNRLKKLSIDPFILRAKLPHMLSFGYVVGAPIALVGAAAAYHAGSPYLGALAYLFGYAAAFIVTVLALRHRGVFR